MIPVENTEFNKNQKSVANAPIHLLAQQFKIIQIRPQVEFDYTKTQIYTPSQQMIFEEKLRQRIKAVSSDTSLLFE